MLRKIIDLINVKINKAWPDQYNKQVTRNTLKSIGQNQKDYKDS